MALVNLTRGTVVARRVRSADTFFKRIAGLLAGPPLGSEEALVIPSVCPQVHTFFMRYAIDCVFLNRDNRVVGVETLVPWRFSGVYPRADRVVELTQGALRRSQTAMGDKLEFEH
ncbi:MAG: DUF192 domain-containing protein [Elusimicrobia bacterium]|nr:DUF192 domain-containing protein [Elusimicrobiota bacterium]